ncbi:Gfo/Idh/MocA family oxidoreductase [candidate division KSB1 bacterium]|nr:Gfo/Idh/MocA family oxidoreductase [candidate division KSB1 bacterium]
MQKFNIGIIGAGMVADFHIDSLKKDGRAQVTWIATKTERTCKEKLHKHAIVNGTTDYKEILNDKSVDAVIIAAPPYLHLEMFQAAVAAGKHVLLEKPAVPNREDLQKLLDLEAGISDLVIVECSCRHARLQPKFRLVKKLIENGSIGDVYHIHHNHLMRSTFIEYNPKGEWAMQKKLAGGGPFIDWGVYDLSFHLGVLNDVPQLQKVTSFTRNGLKVFKDRTVLSDIEEHGAAWMEFDTGLTYYYERGAGVHCEVANETRIYGTRGSLRFAFCTWDPPQIEHFYVDGGGMEKRAVIPVDMAGHENDNYQMAVHFIDCLEGKSEPAMTVPLAGKHLEIFFRIVEGAG